MRIVIEWTVSQSGQVWLTGIQALDSKPLDGGSLRPAQGEASGGGGAINYPGGDAQRSRLVSLPRLDAATRSNPYDRKHSDALATSNSIATIDLASDDGRDAGMRRSSSRMLLPFVTTPGTAGTAIPTNPMFPASSTAATSGKESQEMWTEPGRFHSKPPQSATAANEHSFDSFTPRAEVVAPQSSGITEDNALGMMASSNTGGQEQAWLQSKVRELEQSLRNERATAQAGSDRVKSLES